MLEIQAKMNEIKILDIYFLPNFLLFNNETL